VRPPIYHLSAARAAWTCEDEVVVVAMMLESVEEEASEPRRCRACVWLWVGCSGRWAGGVRVCVRVRVNEEERLRALRVVCGREIGIGMGMDNPVVEDEDEDEESCCCCAWAWNPAAALASAEEEF